MTHKIKQIIETFTKNTTNITSIMNIKSQAEGATE